MTTSTTSQSSDVQRPLKIELDNIACCIVSHTNRAYELLNGRKVRITLSGDKYEGRTGRIVGVLGHGVFGITACVMIYKQNSASAFLNSDSESRRYRSLSEFEILE